MAVAAAPRSRTPLVPTGAMIPLGMLPMGRAAAAAVAVQTLRLRAQAVMQALMVVVVVVAAVP